MYKFLLSLVLFVSTTSFSQKGNVAVSQDSVIDKWIHAVVNIEGQYSSEKARLEFHKQLNEKKITEKEYRRKFDSLAINTPSANGTAVFIRYNEHHFLLTARHVLSDAGNENKLFWTIKLVENLGSPRNNDSGVQVDQNRNVSVSRGGEVSFLFGVDARNVASNDSGDLAIINIDYVPAGSAFLETLKKRGYIPIEVSDIDTAFGVTPGRELMAVGFPPGESVVDRHRVGLPFSTIHVEQVTVPFISTGFFVRQASINFFEASIFVYHGFSGGPVISNNKLVGIVSGALLEDRTVVSKQPTLNYYRLNHLIFVKSSLVLPLLKEAVSLKGFRG